MEVTRQLTPARTAWTHTYYMLTRYRQACWFKPQMCPVPGDSAPCARPHAGQHRHQPPSSITPPPPPEPFQPPSLTAMARVRTCWPWLLTWTSRPACCCAACWSSWWRDPSRWATHGLDPHIGSTYWIHTLDPRTESTHWIHGLGQGGGGPKGAVRVGVRRVRAGHKRMSVEHACPSVCLLTCLHASKQTKVQTRCTRTLRPSPAGDGGAAAPRAARRLAVSGPAARHAGAHAGGRGEECVLKSTRKPKEECV